MMLAGAVTAHHLPGMEQQPAETTTADHAEDPPGKPVPAPSLPKEIGGVEGPEPTRYGDWQHKGRVTDF